MLVVYQPLSVLIALTSQTCYELSNLSLHLFQFSCPLLRVTILLPCMYSMKYSISRYGLTRIEILVILYLTGLNYYGLLKPFVSSYIDVYVFAM